MQGAVITGGNGKKKRGVASRRHVAMNALIHVVAVVFFGMARSLPLTAASNLAARFGRFAGGHFLNHRNIARNLRKAFPELSEQDVGRLVASIYENVARVAAEAAHLEAFYRGDKGATITVEGRDNLPRAGAAVFVGAHLSNWDVGVVALARELGGVNALFTPLEIPAIDSHLEHFRKSSGATYLPRGRASLKTILDQLAGGRSVAMLVDQRAESGVAVTFFGHDSWSSDFPARLALRYNVPIIPVDGERRSPTDFVVRIHTPIRPGDFSGDDKYRDMTQQVMAALEGFIRRSPENWFCHRIRWKN